MTANSTLKFVFLIVAVTCSQLVFAQQAQSDLTQQSLVTNPVQEVKPPNKVSVIVEWPTILNFSLSKTEISVDKSVVCELKSNVRICNLSLEPGVREIALNDNLDFGTYSEKFNLEIGKRYKIQVVLNLTNAFVDSLFGELPVTAMFRKKGKNASVKFELVSVTDEPINQSLLENRMTAGALAYLAAYSSFNTTNINLIGLAQTGIEFIPFG